MSADVLILTKSTGGLAVYNRRLAPALQERGHRLHMGCLSEGADAFAAEMRDLGVDATPIAMTRYAIDPLGDPGTIAAVVRLARRLNARAIVGHGAKAGLIARIAARVMGGDPIVCHHSQPYLWAVQGRAAPLYWGLEMLGRPLGGRVVTLTDPARRSYVASRLGAHERVSVIRTGVDPARFAPPADRAAARLQLGLDPSRPCVGWMGRLEPQKAPALFVDAIASAALPEQAAQILMIGEGRQAAEIDAAVERRGLSGRIARMAWTDDPAAAFRAMDVFVMTSLWEGLPLALLEAMASGCAVICPPLDGCRDVVRDGADGLIHDPRATESLADAIRTLVCDAPARTALAEAATRRIEDRYGVDAMVDAWSALLSSAGRCANRDSSQGARRHA
jgi:glycosyltransferase involved in cell wall biosynthesis